MRKRVYALVAFLLASLFIASVEASERFVISPSDEAIKKIKLTPPSSVFGNISVNNGFVDFYITNPSYDIVYQSQKTSFDSFNFAANESGTYVMHFANKYQSENVEVTLSYGCNIFVQITETVGVSDSVTITRVQPPYIILTVSPPAFPVVGQFWKLEVFYQTNSSNGIPHYLPLPNATIEVTIIIDDQKEIRSYTTDAFGQFEFQFLAEYSDISFQAVYGANKSDIFALTQRSPYYVRSDYVELIFQSNLLILAITTISEGILLHYRKRIKVVFNWLIGGILCFSLIMVVISRYAQMNLWTPWGYPASIFDLVRWDSLGYASLICLVLFAILNVLAYLLKQKSSEMVVPLK